MEACFDDEDISEDEGEKLKWVLPSDKWTDTRSNLKLYLDDYPKINFIYLT